MAQSAYDLITVGDARRARALPLIMGNPSRVPNHLFSGPDVPRETVLEDDPSAKHS